MALQVMMIETSALFFRNYAYLLADPETGQAALIDPVWDKKKYLHLLENNKLTLSSILLTHSHPDHTQLADMLALETGCEVRMSGIEIDYYHFTCHNLIPIDDGETIFLGKEPIIPVLTPGHTAGSLCYMTGNEIFTGDTLFIEGCGMCFGRGADPSVMFDSLQMLKKIITPAMKVYPAHSFGEKPGIAFKEVLCCNIYLDFRKKQDFISFRMRKNQKLIFAFK